MKTPTEVTAQPTRIINFGAAKATLPNQVKAQRPNNSGKTNPFKARGSQSIHAPEQPIKQQSNPVLKAMPKEVRDKLPQGPEQVVKALSDLSTSEKLNFATEVAKSGIESFGKLTKENIDEVFASPAFAKDVVESFNQESRLQALAA